MKTCEYRHDYKPRKTEPLAPYAGCGCMIASFLLVLISVATVYVALVKIINALP